MQDTRCDILYFTEDEEYNRVQGDYMDVKQSIINKKCLYGFIYNK